MARSKAMAAVKPLPTAKAYRFAKVGEHDSAAGVVDLSTDKKIALLAGCIADQQRAGFGELLDLREVPCPLCKAPGFNTGWGFWLHTCGAEVMPDGEVDRPCDPAETA